MPMQRTRHPPPTPLPPPKPGTLYFVSMASVPPQKESREEVFFTVLPISIQMLMPLCFQTPLMIFLYSGKKADPPWRILLFVFSLPSSMSISMSPTPTTTTLTPPLLVLLLLKHISCGCNDACHNNIGGVLKMPLGTTTPGSMPLRTTML